MKSYTHTQGGAVQSAVAIVTECGATSCGRVNAEVYMCVCVLFKLSLYYHHDLFQHPVNKHTEKKVAEINPVCSVAIP